MLRNLSLSIFGFVLFFPFVRAQDHTLDLSWPQPNGVVYTTSLDPSGETLYVGGLFTEVAGQPRQNLAAIDVATRTVTSWAPEVNDLIYTMLALGDSVVVTGSFTTVNGASRIGLAAIDGSTGSVANWAPAINFQGFLPIVTMIANGGRLYVGGPFDLVNGQPRTSIACFDGATGALTPWAPVLGYFDEPRVYDMDINGDAIILSGEFATVNGVQRVGFAEVDGLSGDVSAFNLGMDGYLLRTLVANGSLYFLGGFTEILGTAQNFFARVQLPAPQLLSWSPPFVVAYPKGMVASPGGILLCGESAVINSVQRSCIAMFDATTGVEGPLMPMLLGTTNHVEPIPGSWILGGSYQPEGQSANYTLVGLTPCTSTTYHADQDGDGLGDPDQFLVACSIPQGHVPNSDDCDDSDPLIGAGTTWFADVDGDLWGDAGTTLVSCQQPGGFVSNEGDCDDTDPLVFPLASCDDGDPLTTNDAFGNMNSCECAGHQVSLEVHLLLDGPFTPGNGTMDDDLRTLGLIPMQEPYSALGYDPGPGSYASGTSAPPERFDALGDNSVVDWVIVELRSPLDPSIPVSTRYLLVERDGDVVDLDGGQPKFPVIAGDYHVAVLHRNHMGVVSAQASTFMEGELNGPIDLADAGTPVFGGSDARKAQGSSLVLHSGDVSFNDRVQYMGAGNDRDPILNRVGGSVPTNIINGYHQEDVNMDGTVRYVGFQNDRDPLLSTIGGLVPTNMRPNTFLRVTE
ncbi:MAG: hypothetical protein IPO05_04545 [Flavobacteriales bacterium]|jgi:hypothetical protein|nr:hypothetical protein [Flavobacteriales bacterium]MBK9512895.1 hypothetical protein [Flavobacteriales bacterium]